MGISLSGDCCHSQDPTTSIRHRRNVGDDLSASLSNSSLHRKGRDVSPQQQRPPSATDSRSNPLSTPPHHHRQPPAEEIPPMLSVADTFDVLMNSGNDDPQSSSSLGGTSGGPLTGSFTKNGPTWKQQQLLQQQQQLQQRLRSGSGATAQRQQILRNATFSSSIGGRKIAILPSTTYIRDDAPPGPAAPATQLRLPTVYPMSDNDAVLDFVEDGDDIGAVMGERMAAGQRQRRGSVNQSLSGSFCSELGNSTSSRRRSRESSVTFNNKTVYAEREREREDSAIPLLGDEVPLRTFTPDRQPLKMAAAHADSDDTQPSQPQQQQQQQEYGYCYEDDDDDVVFPAHNVIVPSPLKAAACPTLATGGASLQDGDISLQVGGSYANIVATSQWSEAELQPIMASPRRERQVVPVHSKTIHQSSLPLSSCEPSLMPPLLHSPTAEASVPSNALFATHDVVTFTMPHAVNSLDNLGESTNPNLLRASFPTNTLGGSGTFDDEFSASNGRTTKQIPLKTAPLETARARPLNCPAPRTRRATGVFPLAFNNNASGSGDDEQGSPRF